MVYITRFIGAAALFSGLVAGLPHPRPDSSINEPAVSAPNGTPITQSVTETAVPTAASGYGGQGYSAPKKESSPYAPPQHDQSKDMTTQAHEMSTTTTHEMSTSTAAAETQTTEAYKSQPTYGSGSSKWDMGGNSNYNDCVQKCLATYSMPTATYAPPPSTATATETGVGATQTVLVAPAQGVLRFFPFAINATVGETVKFVWGANNHTFTKGSALLPCNQSKDALTFTSGRQQKGFTFDLKINDTEPIFFFCNVPTHCQKGMFGMINAPSAAGSKTSVGSMMPQIAANNSQVAAYAVYSANQTKGDAKASGWGNNIDMGALPEWAHEYVAENVLYDRALLANNKDLVKDDGSIDLSAAATNPLMIPQDLTAVMAASSSPSSGSTPASTSASAQATESGVNTPSGNLSTSGASSLTSSRLAATAVVAFAAWLLL